MFKYPVQTSHFGPPYTRASLDWWLHLWGLIYLRVCGPVTKLLTNLMLSSLSVPSAICCRRGTYSGFDSSFVMRVI